MMLYNNDTFQITVFKSLYDIKTDNKIIKNDWNEFSKFLEKLSKLSYTKKTAPLISPAIYSENATRANKNVLAWAGWAALDIDSHPFNDTNDIKHYMDDQHGDKSYICYSTASSSIKKPKFRLVFPLSTWIKNLKEIRKFWLSLNKEFEEIADQQTKDLSRMYFVPAIYKESDNNFFWCINKNPINPISLIEKHSIDTEISGNSVSSFFELLPENIKNEISLFRENQLKSNYHKYTWTNYQDCPFIKSESLQNYQTIVLSKSAGRYKAFYSLIVSIISSAILKGYPISSYEVKKLILEIDANLDSYYKNRKIDVEIERAFLWVYQNVKNNK